jgi:hypothetical protein
MARLVTEKQVDSRGTAWNAAEFEGLLIRTEWRDDSPFATMHDTLLLS